MEDFLSLTEMLEEQLQGPRNQRRVVVHNEVDQNTQKHSSPFIVHFQNAVSFTVRSEKGQRKVIGHKHCINFDEQ